MAQLTRKRPLSVIQEPAVPEGFCDLSLPPNWYLLVTLDVIGNWQTNAKTRSGKSLLMKSFKVDAKLSQTCPENFVDLARVLPKMANIVSLNDDVSRELRSHLWHLGVDTNLSVMEKNYDMTGRSGGKSVGLSFTWHLKGPCGI